MPRPEPRILAAVELRKLQELVPARLRGLLQAAGLGDPAMGPLRLALMLNLAVLALILINLLYTFDLPLWLALLALAAAGLAGAAAFRRNSEPLFLNSLLGTGLFGLLAVAAAMSVPAWQVLDEGASASWAGRMAPLLAAALALYASHLWIETTARERLRKPLDRLADMVAGPRLAPALITSLVLCAGFILVLEWFAVHSKASHVITRRFLERGIIPPLTVWLFFWGLLLLLGKLWNNRQLARAVRGWQEGAAAEPDILAEGLNALTGAPEALEDQLEFLWRRHEESYLIPRYISWAVPVLGFVGTVLGISLAAEGIRRIISSETGLAGLSGDLGGAIAPLGIAFDTTLIALSLSIVLVLILSLVQRGEERILSTAEQLSRKKARAS